MTWWMTGMLLAQATTGTVSPYFTQIPQLVRAATSNNSSSHDYSRYTFEIEVPDDTLGGLVIGIPEGEAWVPTAQMVAVSNARGQSVPFKVDIVERNVTINFTQSVPAQKITVYLEPMRNPRTGGPYLFDIAAFPMGNATKPQFLGFGRLSFTQGGSGGR